MSAIADLFARGGLCMYAISAVGLLGYGLLALAAVRPTRPRALTVVRACVALAPLLGLLGTVTGMMASFDAMMRIGQPDAVARGIAQALLTTEYGLMVALPGLLGCALVEGRRAASA